MPILIFLLNSLCAAAKPGAVSSRGSVATAGTSVRREFIGRMDSLYYARDRAGAMEEGISLLKQYLRRHPQDGQACWRLSRFLVRKGESTHSRREKLRWFRMAREAAEKAVQIRPRDTQAHFWLGISLGRYGEAKGIWRSLFLIKPMRDQMRLILELNPRHGGAYHVLGEMDSRIPRWAGGSLKRAVEEMSRAMALEPTYTIHYMALAHMYLERGKKDKAKEILNKMLAIENPLDPVDAKDDFAEARALLSQPGF